MSIKYEIGQVFEGRIAMKLEHDEGQNERWGFLKSYEITEDHDEWGASHLHY